MKTTLFIHELYIHAFKKACDIQKSVQIIATSLDHDKEMYMVILEFDNEVSLFFLGQTYVIYKQAKIYKNEKEG